MASMIRAFLVGLMGLAVAACASDASTGPQRISGSWDWHFETSAFMTDAGAGPYWLSAQGAVWGVITAPIERSGRGPWGRLHLVVEGELSGPGQYGHLGAYERELRVTRVIESTLIAADGPPSNN
jgi:hypothetical protein